MSKRFIDTDLFNKKWFRKLPENYKLLWVYILTSCDLAGIWEVDFERAEFNGCKVTEKKAVELFEKQILIIENNKRWLVKDFCDFQYGKLSPKSPVHKKVIGILESHSCNGINLYNTLLNRVLCTLKEEDKDKEEEKEEDKEEDKDGEKKEIKTKYAEFVLLTEQEFEKLKIELGDDTAKAIEILNNYKGANGKKYKSDYLAIKNWVIDRVRMGNLKLKPVEVGKEKSYSNDWVK